ncbi:uracil-DNA glycosylase family protein [Fibrobacterota bacterium]
MEYHNSLAGYLAWQAELGGDDVILEHVPADVRIPCPARGRNRDSVNSETDKSNGKNPGDTESLSNSLERVLAETSRGQSEKTDKEEDFIHKKMFDLPELNSLSDLYNYLQKSHLYNVSASAGWKESISVVKPTGNPDGELSVVSMVPTETDLKRGCVFQGEDGDLLNKMLESIDIKREDAYCTCVLKNPHLSKILNWRQKNYHRQVLEKELFLTGSKLVMILGEKCCQLMLKTGKALETLRKSLHFFKKNDILKDKKVIVTYHPHQLIMNQKLKYSARDDLLWLQKVLRNETAR